jgi:hypothetical protein
LDIFPAEVWIGLRMSIPISTKSSMSGNTSPPGDSSRLSWVPRSSPILMMSTLLPRAGRE